MRREIWIGVAAAAVILGGLFVYAYWQRSADTAEPPPASAETIVEAADGGKIQYPVPDVPPTEPALPSLADSDKPFHEALTALFGTVPIESFLIPKLIIQKTVVTLNSLDGQIVPLRLWPLANVPKLPVVDIGTDGSMTLSADNSQRYARYVAAVKAVDAKALAQMYLHYYPLFQQAYVELGFPDRYFNDRLISVLDHLLLAPEVEGPIRLKRPKVLYEYESYDLESLSAGQKLLIRMWAQNAAIVKDKIKQFRDAVAAASSPGPEVSGNAERIP